MQVCCSNKPVGKTLEYWSNWASKIDWWATHPSQHSASCILLQQLLCQLQWSFKERNAHKSELEDRKHAKQKHRNQENSPKPSQYQSLISRFDIAF